MKKSISIILIVLALVLSAVLIINSFMPSKDTVPKNIIIFISDGCGYNQVEAASIYQYGEPNKQIYAAFPVQYAVSTYSFSGKGYSSDSAKANFDYLKRKPTDSAAAATAIFAGVKTYNGFLGVDTNKVPVENMVERAEKLGKSSGVITSVQFSHATPAGASVHNAGRGNYEEIARDMLNSQLDVIMGAGHPLFDDNSQPVTEANYRYTGGQETWEALTAGKVGKDADGDNEPDPWVLIQNRSDFQKLMTGSTPKRVIGVPKVQQTLQQSRSGDDKADPYSVALNDSVPTLAEMTAGALNVLDNNQKGFYLMVEGGAVDWSGHANQSGRVIEEEIDFNYAVEAAIAWVEKNSSWDETMIIITADHETGYLTGPGSGVIQSTSGGKKSITNPLINNGKGKLPGMEWHIGDHTNSLVPLFAKGAGSDRFHQYADEHDAKRGKYIDNIEIAKVVFSLFEAK
jgi:alkaline phosphatase